MIINSLKIARSRVSLKKFVLKYYKFDMYARKLNYSIPKLTDLKCVIYVSTSKMN